ncbi:hypothetical protein K431DRAFT_279572 [Polychaeton citri CBS 116435]|uniref:DUF521-domain-containing protein n=1 Tax=Polychaeton citri CBS 116435 TaxID=1314669 RepID=A0A9P4PY14_9PEZI|nr:hypothetical protein K431DRAFT_279572 [Polychaeton citri CBS 116435]
MTVDQTNAPAFYQGTSVLRGTATGPVVGSNTAISFWGGVDPQTGTIIDQHHPLAGESVVGKVLAVPSSRGSCTGSGVLLELMLNGNAPAALVFERDEAILTLGIIIAREFLGRSIPVVRLHGSAFAALLKDTNESVAQEELVLSPNLSLTSFDRQLLDGSLGRAAQAAARVVVQMAMIQSATELIDVTQAHIDCCIYTGPATLYVAQQLCSWKARVRVPASMNSISIDRIRWQAQGVDPAMANPAGQLADAYVEMGAKPTYTCAPYLLEDTAPVQGEQIIWAESNAVVYANSVLGARTIKCPDFLDICVALTGRAPNIGCHIEANRLAQLEIALAPDLRSIVENLPEDDMDALFPLLGYIVGEISETRIPIVTGLVGLKSINDDRLKAFGAAFATTSGAPMFHIAGITPEASTTKDITLQVSATEPSQSVSISVGQLSAIWKQFNSTESLDIDLISLGNPHFSYAEIQRLTQLCQGRKKSPNVTIMMTCGRKTYQNAYRDGLIPALEAFGVQPVTDTCWCMITEPTIPLTTKTIMTNSGKYAHYGKGLTGRQMRFGSLRDCFEAACLGSVSGNPPAWLQ